MRCVLIVDEKIAAVSECNTPPTAPGWKTAWYGEDYAVGESVLLFDEKLRRKPIDAGSVYGRAVAEKEKAVENARLARIAADNAAQDRKNAEADLEKVYAQVEALYQSAEQKAAKERALLEFADIAEKAVLAEEEAVQNALQSLTEKIGNGLNTIRNACLDLEEKILEEKPETKEPEKPSEPVKESKAGKADVKPSAKTKEKKDK
jgi:hypothetical protein